MQKKNKSQLNNPVELHFITTLSLEESISLMENLADKQYRINIRELGSDEYEFQIDYIPRKLVRSTVVGTIQGWNGTESKIDARGITGFTKASQESKWASKLSSGIVILSLLPLLSLPLILNEGWLVWATMMIGGILIALVANFASRHINAFLFGLPSNQNLHLAGFNSRYDVFQKIRNEFALAGDIEKILKV